MACHVLVELEPILEQRSILGVSIKYGEDRFLTRQIIKAGYLTTMTHAARCRTFVPNNLPEYFSQQLRWRRSNIVDYSGAVSHVWRLNPLLAIHFFAQCALLIAMRADFYPDLMNSDLWPVDAGQRLEITPLRGEALKAAIVRPAEQRDMVVEPALLEKLLADAAYEPGSLPML